MFDATASPRLGEKPKPNSPSNYKILQFRMGDLNIGFDSDQSFPRKYCNVALYVDLELAYH